MNSAHGVPAFMRAPGFYVAAAGILAALWVAFNVAPVWEVQGTRYDVYTNASGELVYQFRGKEQPVVDAVARDVSPLRAEALASGEAPARQQQWVIDQVQSTEGTQSRYSLLQARSHLGLWSLLPAVIAIALCLITKEALSSLLMGVVVGAFMLGRFDLTDAVLIPSLATRNAATILLLYLWLVGGLTGIWSRTGAARAFAQFMTQHFVRGPRSAKFVCWLMGVLFFQGGTISVVLVGTIVKPVADAENISHEELAYIVDSTASPIASVLAFNAWPAYVQALIFVPGVSFLATESERIAFFFSSVKFSFYSLFAVAGTLLLSLGVTRFAGKGLRQARQRARDTGQLDAPDATPMSARELHETRVPEGYQPQVFEFFVPLMLLVGIAVGTFIYRGSPQVNWAFGAALLSSVLFALFKGMRLRAVIEGIGDGLKGVVLASVVLMLAITIGAISREVGAGIYLVAQLGETIPYWVLPVLLQILTMTIAFSTGTSWGTYAIAFPLAMPLAWQIGQVAGLDDPLLFMSLCFAAVLNGSVYGDQCSPISDTTILSAMTTGCDLMDHVKTQIVPATGAAALAGFLWTVLAVTMLQSGA
ncbi:MAG: Na+/H+ antiporter NhaC family protein [Gammaproteobacteria bacterium]